MPLSRRSTHNHTHTLVGNPHSTFNGSDPSMLVDPSLEALVELPPAAGIDASTARKAQNRVAQREFRQRKQEYIRALECRVDLLSCPRLVQIDRLRWMLRQLMLENAKLRVLLGVISAHVAASGAGGFLGAHPLVRTELERYVFSQSEQRSIHSWDPHGSDQYGHIAMHELAAQTAAPPSRAPIHPHPLLASFDAPPRLRRTRTCPGSPGASAEEPALKRRRTIKQEERSPSPVPGPIRRRSLSHPPPLPVALGMTPTVSGPTLAPSLATPATAPSASTAATATAASAAVPDVMAFFSPISAPGSGPSADTKAIFAAKYRAHMSLDREGVPPPRTGPGIAVGTGSPAPAPASAPVSPAPPSDSFDLWFGGLPTYTSPTLMPAQS